MGLHVNKLFYALLLSCGIASFACADVEFELLPRGRLFRLTTADPREIQMSIGIHSHDRIDASIGNYFSLVEMRESGNQEPIKIQFGLEGAANFTMRQIQQRFPLETTDGILGLCVDSRWGSSQAQLRFTHTSAHLSDGAFGAPIAYSRESLSLRYSHLWSEDFQVYGGVYFPVHAIPSTVAWYTQAGFSYFWVFQSRALVPFVAMDIQWKRESAYDPSMHLELGLALNNPPEAYRSFRVFYSFFTGADPRGQYYTRPLTAHSLGIEMQI